MNEAEWLECADTAMLFESEPLYGKISERKYRLFAVACCRRIWRLFRHAPLREAIEISERYADGRASEADLKRVVAWFEERYGTQEGLPAEEWAISAAFVCVTQVAYRLAGEAAYHCSGAIERDDSAEGGNSAEEERAQCDLIRDLFGYPLRRVTIKRAWRTPTVKALAAAAYDNRDLPAGTFQLDRLAVLADALEDAGCTDRELLAHLRSPGPHVRGCFAVDAVLGKM